MRYLKIPNDKNKKSCDQNDETFWSHDLTKIEIAFEISCGDVDSLVIFVITKSLAWPLPRRPRDVSESKQIISVDKHVVTIFFEALNGILQMVVLLFIVIVIA